LNLSGATTTQPPPKPASTPINSQQDLILAKNIYTTLTQFEDDLHENQSEFQKILDSVAEHELQMYQDMALLEQTVRKNERTKLLLTHSTDQISVVEESQNYMLKMLSELEGDLAHMLQQGIKNPRSLTDQDVMPDFRARNSERLFQRLDTLCAEMKDNDKLIAEAMRKMHQIDIMQSDATIERFTGGAANASEAIAKSQIHQTIQETINGFVNSLNVIEIESRELAAKTNQIKRKIELAK